MASLSQASAALHAYRHLLRASRLTFGGDPTVLRAAEERIRQEFDAAKGERQPEKIQKLISAAHENADFLMRQVIQAPLSDKQSTFRVVLKPQHASVIGTEGKLEAPTRPAPRASREAKAHQHHEEEEEKTGCCGGCSEFKD
ncbi:MAG: LYR motif-containing protein [archaeon]|nr:LYR motif-containing protein [archaeon]